MQDGEKGHFNAEQHGGYTDFEVGGLNSVVWFDGAGAGEEGNENGLPERKKDDEFDGKDFEEGAMLLDVVAELDVELNEAIHGDGNSDGFNDHEPDMGEGRVEGGKTVPVKGLSDDGDDCTKDSNEAILENGDPDDVEPGQATSRGAQPSVLFASGTFLEISHGPDPFLGGDCSKVGFLLVEVGGNVGAKEGEEGGDGERFVTVADDFKVDTVVVIVEGEEGNGGVDGDHEQNANDVSLFPRFEIMGGMHEDEEEGDEDGDEGKGSGQPQAEVMKGIIMPYWIFGNDHVLLGGVAYWPRHGGACVGNEGGKRTWDGSRVWLRTWRLPHGFKCDDVVERVRSRVERDCAGNGMPIADRDGEIWGKKGMSEGWAVEIAQAEGPVQKRKG